MIEIIRIPAFKDNYIWLLTNKKHQHAVVVDPGDAVPVLEVLNQTNLHLSAILITHHHDDHTNGIHRLIEHHKIPVYGPKRDSIPFLTHPLQEGDTVSLDVLNIHFKVLDIPGHTLGHIAYFGQGVLFSGDTLFTAGCGRVFEGTMEQMLHSLTKLSHLPKETLVYCGHEYTLENLYFALSIEPNNKILFERFQQVRDLRNQHIATVPSLLKLELETNPFLRTEVKEVIDAANRISKQKLTKKVEVFRVIREEKNKFKHSYNNTV